MEKKTRNGYVDLLRFLASYVIVFFHLGIAPYYTRDGVLGTLLSGALFVEFFFLLSGYFSIKSFSDTSSKKGLTIYQYMLKRYVHFLPYSFLTAAISFIWTIVSKGYSFKDNIKVLSMLPFEALLLDKVQ